MAVLLTNSGVYRMVAELMKQAFWGGWGVGEGVASKADGNCFDSEEGRAETSKTLINSATIQHIWTLTAPEDCTITEACIFSSETGYTLIFHATFTAMPLLTGDRIEFTLTHETS